MIYLAQTDTTVGLLSRTQKALAEAKGRDPDQPAIACVSSLRKLKKQTRIPPKHRKIIRRSRKTTFVYLTQKAYRVVFDTEHNQLLGQFDLLYSTSANPHGQPLNIEWAKGVADVIITPPKGFHHRKASKIVKLGRERLWLLRKL